MPIHWPSSQAHLHSLAGPAKVHEYRALLLFAPNTTAGEEVMAAFARSVACPEDSAKKAPMSSSFYAMFRQPIAQDECTPQYLCLSNANCSAHLQGRSRSQFRQFANPLLCETFNLTLINVAAWIAAESKLLDHSERKLQLPFPSTNLSSARRSAAGGL